MLMATMGLLLCSKICLYRTFLVFLFLNVSHTKVIYYLSHVVISATPSINIMNPYSTKISKDILYTQ